MHPRYPSVFSPIRLGPVELPNRYFFAPRGSARNTVPEDALPPGDLFHRHEKAEEREPSEEPREGFGPATLTPRCDREHTSCDEETQE